MASYWPTRLKSFWAVGRSKAAMVAPARLLAVPKRTMPDRVKVCGGPISSTRTRSPMWKWYLVAVDASMTTSFGVVGGDPLRRWRADICETGLNDRPMVGAPVVFTDLPSGATSWAKPWTLPTASATPGTPLTVWPTDWAMGLRTAVSAGPLNAAFPRTSKSTCW